MAEECCHGIVITEVQSFDTCILFKAYFERTEPMIEPMVAICFPLKSLIALLLLYAAKTEQSISSIRLQS